MEEIKALVWRDLATQMSLQLGIDLVLILAVIETESHGDQWAVKYEPRYTYLYEPRQFAANLRISMETEETLQRMSYGLMQPMGGVCREHGFLDNLMKMTDPALSMLYGCKHLKKKMQKYGTDECTVYAAYNAGAPRKTPGGMFVNQKHVDNFYQNLLKVQAAI